MKIKHTWTVKEDQEYGGLGLFMKGWPNHFNSVQMGRLLAHDILEHAVDKNIGSFENELQALGAMMLVRGEWNCYNPNSQNGYADSIADELMTQIRSYNIESVKPAPRIVWGAIREQFGTIPQFRASVKRECDREECEFPNWTNDNFRDILRWLEIGYRKAVKMYGPGDGKMYGLFQEIERKFPKHLEEYQQYESIVDTKKQTFFIEEIYEDFED